MYCAAIARNTRSVACFTYACAALRQRIERRLQKICPRASKQNISTRHCNSHGVCSCFYSIWQNVVMRAMQRTNTCTSIVDRPARLMIFAPIFFQTLRQDQRFLARALRFLITVALSR
jgi:hypothetical protein